MLFLCLLRQFVCVNRWISETTRARVIKFTDNMFYSSTQNLEYLRIKSRNPKSKKKEFKI